MPKMTVVKVIKRKDIFKLFIDESKEYEVNLGQVTLDEIEEVLFYKIGKACGYDLLDEDAYAEYSGLFWGIDFFDPEDLNEMTHNYSVKVVFNGFGKQGVVKTLYKATQK